MKVTELLMEKCAVNFRNEPEEPYKAGYNTTLRYFALNGIQTKLADVITLIEEYAADPEDKEQEFVARDYDGMLNELRKWNEVLTQDLSDVDIDTDLEANNR